MLPSDQTVALTFATQLIGDDDAAAVEVFEALAGSGLDRREVWLGLATVCLRIGAFERAAVAISRLLSTHACASDTPIARLANAVASASGAPGWCAVDFDGVLVATGRGPVVTAIDGRAIARAIRLPREWKQGRLLNVTVNGANFLGSPVDLRRIRAIEGFVCAVDDGLAGWAWHPADPARPPELCLSAGALRRTIVADAIDTEGVDGARALMQARRFAVSAAVLTEAGFGDGPITVEGTDGRALLGSPIDPGFERRGAIATTRGIARTMAGERASADGAPGLRSVPADIRGTSPPVGWVAGGRTPGVSVIIPFHDGGLDALACLDSVLATLPAAARLILVDDASRDPAVVAALTIAAKRRGVTLLRSDRNRGFVVGANSGMRAAVGRDVILLNSDTLVPPCWVERLRDAVRGGAAGIGTASPLSNDATILSYPATEKPQPMPDLRATARLSAQAARANGDAVVEVPTTVGFCMAIRADCLAATGLFRDDVFAQGYGEENDFCLRARHLGWRHVAVPGLFVAHRDGGSFGPARTHLIRRNLALLERMHPGYAVMIEAFGAEQPLRPARRRLDTVRFRAARPLKTRSVLLVTHDGGGGTERVVSARVTAIRAVGDRAIVLRPVVDETMSQTLSIGVRVADGDDPTTPDLQFRLPAELPALVRLLAAERPALVEFQHLLGHHPTLLGLPARLGVPYWVHTHDYALFCPRIALVSTEGRYCGEPSLAGCEACVADLGSLLEETIGVAALRARSAALLAGAARVIAPSQDTAARFARHFPGIAPDVTPLEPSPSDGPRARPPLVGGRVRVVVLGAIGIEKGYELLLAAARDAATRRVPIEFVVVGHTTDDARLLDTGRVFVTGAYSGVADGAALLVAQRAHVGWLPSVWPETWCFVLGELWAAGLDVMCFDLGAPADRVRASGRGRAIPLGLPTPAIVDALLAAGRRTGDEGGRATPPDVRRA